MIKLIYDNKDTLDKLAAEYIATNLKKVYIEKGLAVLAVPGGRSISGVFAYLIEQDLNWSKVHIFLVDERLVLFNSVESNFILVSDYLTGRLLEEKGLPINNIHPFIYNPNMDEYGPDVYQKELSSLGGKFDVALLSSGEDGHIGALYPHHHSIENVSEYFISMSDSPKPPSERMSSSLNLLKRSKYGVLLFYGEGKRQAFDNYLNDKLKIVDCPAKLVNELSNALILTDIK